MGWDDAPEPPEITPRERDWLEIFRRARDENPKLEEVLARAVQIVGDDPPLVDVLDELLDALDGALRYAAKKQKRQLKKGA